MSTHKPRSYSVNDFLSWNERKELILQPKFQRRDIWPTKVKSHLIDTVLRGLPVPIIFIRQNIDPRQRRTIREVVDGQQRLRSIIAFSNDEFPVLKSQNPSFGCLNFNQLPSEAQEDFLNYEFSVVLLEGATDRDVLDIFARLNTYAQKLTPQELLNAAYFGEFKQTVYSLGYEHLEFWRGNGILTDRQIIRMAEAELSTELIITMLAGIQHRRGRPQEFYAKYDDAFHEKDRIQKEFKSIIDTIVECFGSKLKGSIYSRRVMFHSLFCAFFHARYGIPSTTGLGKGGVVHHLGSSELLKIRDSLLLLESRYKQSPIPNDLKSFFEASQGGTSDRDKRIIRTKIILDYILMSAH
jgi:hypothetical protein